MMSDIGITAIERVNGDIDGNAVSDFALIYIVSPAKHKHYKRVHGDLDTDSYNQQVEKRWVFEEKRVTLASRDTIQVSNVKLQAPLTPEKDEGYR